MLPWNDRKGFRHWILSSALNFRQLQLLSMIDYSTDKNSLAVDIGCNVGYLTRPLFSRTYTVGLDVDKNVLSSTKACNRDIDFICCDLCHLPLKKSSVNLVVCASVFEHVEKLSEALNEIKIVLKKEGKLAAGYPIETRLLDYIMKSFWRSESQVWDQGNIVKHKDRLKNPHTHKSSYKDIRRNIEKNFLILKKQKMPRNYFPDSLSIYENIILMRRENRNSRE